MAKKYKSTNEMNNKSSLKSPHTSADITVTSAGSPGWPLLIVGSIAFFVLLTLAGSMDNIIEKWIGLFSSVLIAVLGLVSKRFNLIKAYNSPIFISVILYVIWGGVSTFYAASGKFAIFEFSKLMFALFAYLLVLSITEKEESGFKKISYILASVGAIYGIVSIDAASAGVLSKIFKSFFQLFTSVFADRGAFEEGIRITGIFGNPNIYAGFMALAVLISLYLTLNVSTRRQSLISAALLAINSIAYLLAFSLGSLFIFLISCIIMLITTEAGKRINLFILMMETAIITFIFAFLSMTGLGKTGLPSYIPLMAIILNAIILYFSDSKLRPLLNSKLENRKGLSVRIVVVAAFLISCYIAAGFTVSGVLNLDSNETIGRAIYVPGGEYRLDTESTGMIQVIIESQNEEDLIRHTSETLYAGSLEKQINFTVPDNSRIVTLRFTAGEGSAKLHSSKYSGASEGNVHLNYPLLPNIVANRLQNIFANENMIQRGIFFEDGMKLFVKSPIIGRGLGGFENGIYSVQNFYYETKYAHNHYIQALSDLGVIGLILFLSILVSCVISMIRSKRNAKMLFAIPVLSACILQSFGQALTDATWSSGVFLGFAFSILALLTLYFSGEAKVQAHAASIRFGSVARVSLVLFSVLFTVLLAGNLYAQSFARSGVKSFSDIERLIAFDRFEHNDYKVSYIVNAPKSDDDKILAKADKYASELMEVESNSIAPYVMIYNFETYKDYDAFEAAKKGIQNAKSSPYMWSRIFDICEEYIDPVGAHTNDAAERLKTPEYYVDSVLELYDALLERNKSSLDQIMLSPYNNTFIGKLLEIRATNLYSIDWTFTSIMTYAFDSEASVDANLDGIPDNISVLSGSISQNNDGLLAVTDNTILNLNLYHKLAGVYRFKIRTEEPQDISVSINDTDQNVSYNGKEAIVTVSLDNNTEMKMSTFKVTFPKAAVIDYITYTTELNKDTM